MEEETDSAYKDVSELKKELEGMKGKRDVSTKELYDAVEKLSQTIANVLEIFGAAAQQMKLEEREYEESAKKHEMIISKLDKLLDQNKTIAEGMVAMVEMVKEKFVSKEKEEKPQEKEPFFKSITEPNPFKPQQKWTRSEQTQRIQQTPINFQQQPMPPPISIPQDIADMPPLEPAPMPDLEPEAPFPLEEEPKRRKLFGMFKS